MSKVIVCDIDGVLASFESAWNPLLARLAGEDKLPKGWQTDPNFPDIWDWDVRAYGRDIVNQGWAEVNKSKKFWTTLDPMPGTEQVCRKLSALQLDHDVFFMTSRPGVGVQRQTCEWLYGMGINYPNVIVVRAWEEKIPLLENLRTQFFIDDKLDTMTEWYQNCYKKGIRTHSNHFYLADAPYNREGRLKDMKVVANIETGLKEAGLWL